MNSKEYIAAHRAEIRATQRAWYQANRERLLAKGAARARTEDRREYEARYRAENAERVKALKRAWYLANKERIAAERAAYYEAHKGHILSQGKDYRAANREAVKARQAKYRAAHQEEIYQAQKSWKERNPDRVLASRLKHMPPCSWSVCSNKCDKGRLFCADCRIFIKFLFARGRDNGGSKKYPPLEQVFELLNKVTPEDLEQWREIRYTRRAQQSAKQSLKTLESQTLANKPAPSK